MITLLAEGRRVLQSPRPRHGRARFQLRDGGSAPGTVPGAGVLVHRSGVSLFLPHVILNTQHIAGNLDE